MRLSVFQMHIPHPQNDIDLVDINVTDLLWHVPMLHSMFSVRWPSQSRPPFLGGGALQSLYLSSRPRPHVTVHCDHSDQSDHWPCAGMFNSEELWLHEIYSWTKPELMQTFKIKDKDKVFKRLATSLTRPTVCLGGSDLFKVRGVDNFTCLNNENVLTRTR